jgi:hypothetical protein
VLKVFFILIIKTNKNRREKTMKKYDITISTSQAFKLEIEASTEQAAMEIANQLSQDEVVEQSYDCSEVDGFPMVVSVEEVA